MIPILAVDSDGCALDAMDAKHRQCFGPAIVEVWGLHAISDAVLKLSLEINLYSRGRGLNRFLALHHLFSLLWKHALLRDGLPEPSFFTRWFSIGGPLSGEALRQYLPSAPAEDQNTLRRLLDWDMEVNRRVQSLGSPLAFEGVGETLQDAASLTRIHVVSSATERTLHHEWEAAGIKPWVDAFHGQEAGTKAAVLQRLAGGRKGGRRVLMVGDAWADHDAAREAGVLFFPIHPGQESSSWRRLREVVLPDFLAGRLTDQALSPDLDAFGRVLRPLEGVTFELT